MIIAAYAATGKSTFAARTDRAVDLPGMIHSWILPPTDKTAAELEKEKGALYHLRNPLFPGNYIAQILRAEMEYDYVLIPTATEVIRPLQEKYGRKVLLCYPGDECRQEYRERFVARGNSESFLSLFSDGWDRFLGPVRENRQGVHIVMGPGQYLADLLPRFEEERRMDLSALVSEDALCGLEEELASYRRDAVLCLWGDEGCCLYRIANLDLPEERGFLYRIGRMILERDTHITAVIELRDCFRVGLPEAFLAGDHGEVISFVSKCLITESDK